MITFLLCLGDSLDLLLRTEGDLSWFVGSGSSFSVAYIGQHFAVPGISTVLKNTISVSSNGWKKLEQWNTQTLTNAMFSSGEVFDSANGK